MIYFFFNLYKNKYPMGTIISMKSTKKQFYKSCFYWYADINISVDKFEESFTPLKI
jgi:hypothetical protein